MASGLQTLHQIDNAIAKARSAVEQAGVLARRASEALTDVKKSEAAQYVLIAKDRLPVLENDQGGALGRVDDTAAKLIDRADALYKTHNQAVEAAQAVVEDLEQARRNAETQVAEAVDRYDQAVAKAEIEILKDTDYQAQIQTLMQIESQILRAKDKQSVAEADEKDKGRVFLADPYFQYLSQRGFGTADAKGWPLTKLLDRWVARRVGYRQSAETYRRLTAIPKRLSRHVDLLENRLAAQKIAVSEQESALLKREGVTELHAQSLAAQSVLEAVDGRLDTAEIALNRAREIRDAAASGETGPLKEAIDLLSQTLAKTDLKTLQRLTAQTVSKTDDAALEELLTLSRVAKDLAVDHHETQKITQKYQSALKDLEGLRKKFKKRRYDAPSSDFSNGDWIASLLGQVVVGALASDDLWKQLGRLQKTVKRYSDTDFGGGDWTEGFRLPKGGSDWEDIFGGSGRSRSRGSRSSRSPRLKLPRSSGGSSRGGGKSSGGFRTGGGF